LGVRSIPITVEGEVLNSKSATDRGFSQLPAWLKSVETAWNGHGKQSRTFEKQINYINQLSAQFPIPKLRIVYAKSGSLPAACIIHDEQAVLDHMLYWAAPKDIGEAHYICGIINSETTRKRIEQFQSKGQFGARHFDKVIWNLPIPRYDSKNKLHRELAAVGARAEAVAAGVELKDGEKFQRARKRVRDGLILNGVAGEIEFLVEKLLGPA
jgi:hypothetical protein